MSVVELSRKKFQFKLDGKIYNVNSPKVREVQELQKNSKGNDDESLEDAIVFLDKLGMPKQVSYEMEADHLRIVLETVCGETEKK